MRVTGFVFCATLFVFSSASADDYKRKDYLESYERTYERSQENFSTLRPIPKPSSQFAQDNSSQNSSYDEYSLYEWTRQRSGTNELPPGTERNSEGY